MFPHSRTALKGKCLSCSLDRLSFLKSDCILEMISRGQVAYHQAYTRVHIMRSGHNMFQTPRSCRLQEPFCKAGRYTEDDLVVGTQYVFMRSKPCSIMWKSKLCESAGSDAWLIFLVRFVVEHVKAPSCFIASGFKYQAYESHCVLLAYRSRTQRSMSALLEIFARHLVVLLAGTSQSCRLRSTCKACLLNWTHLMAAEFFSTYKVKMLLWDLCTYILHRT